MARGEGSLQGIQQEGVPWHPQRAVGRFPLFVCVFTSSAEDSKSKSPKSRNSSSSLSMMNLGKKEQILAITPLLSPRHPTKPMKLWKCTTLIGVCIFIISWAWCYFKLEDPCVFFHPFFFVLKSTPWNFNKHWKNFNEISGFGFEGTTINLSPPKWPSYNDRGFKMTQKSGVVWK